MEDNTPFSNDVSEEIKTGSPQKENISTESENDSEQTQKLVSEIQEQKDKYLRLVAEFDNYKRRTAKERIELSQTAGKEIILSLLDVLDDCERAEKQLQTSEDITQVREGIMLVFNKFRNFLQQKGVSAMQSLDTDFDVEKHEAIAEIEVDKAMKGKVSDELQKGYYLHDKILRFAKVIVGK